MKKIIFHFTIFFGWGLFLIHHFWKNDQKMTQAKKICIQKITSVIWLNHARIFEIHIYFHSFLSEVCHSCALPFLRQKCLRRASINSELQIVSMVESTPENLAPYLLYWWFNHLCKFWNISSFTFPNIIPEPSMSQQCTTWQKNHLNLANMAYFHHFCLKQSKTAQILMKGGSIIYKPPCICYGNPLMILLVW